VHFLQSFCVYVSVIKILVDLKDAVYEAKQDIGKIKDHFKKSIFEDPKIEEKSAEPTVNKAESAKKK
jgi:hypothetical protein